MESHINEKVTWKLVLLGVMKIPINIIYLFLSFSMPFIALLIVSVVAVLSTAFPIYIVICLINKVAPGLICIATEYFCYISSKFISLSVLPFLYKASNL